MINVQEVLGAAATHTRLSCQSRERVRGSLIELNHERADQLATPLSDVKPHQQSWFVFHGR